MSWSEIIGHDAVLERFRRAASKGRLASTYLFVGPSGIGKRTFALKLAQAVLCQTNPEEMLEPCGHCSACQQVAAFTHPDLMQISKPKDKAYIPVETFIGDREHRMQVGLCHDIGLKPFSGSRKVAIIDDADALNQESANALLKTLEEPPQGSVIILIGTSQHRQLSTIVSRSQVVRFEPLDTGDVVSILQKLNLELEGQLEDLAASSAGSIERAMMLSDSSVREFRNALLSRLASLDPGAQEFAKSTSSYIEAAGKDAAAKRVRAIALADFVVEFYHQLLLAVSGQSLSGDSELMAAVRNAATAWESDAENVGLAIHRTLDFQRHISANANAANAIQCWYSDLGKLNRGEVVPAI